MYIPTALGSAVILLEAVEDIVILFPDAYIPNGISPSARLAAVTFNVPPLSSIEPWWVPVVLAEIPIFDTPFTFIVPELLNVKFPLSVTLCIPIFSVPDALCVTFTIPLFLSIESLL